MARIWNTFNTKCWWGYGATGTLLRCWWECKVVLLLWKRVWQCLTKLKILLPYDPAITLLGIYSKELKTYVHTKIFMGMFTAALFMIARTWKQTTCPSVGEWINKLWSIWTVNYYSALKRNEPPSHEDMEETYLYITKWEKPIWKGYLLYGFNYMTVWKRQY